MPSSALADDWYRFADRYSGNGEHVYAARIVSASGVAATMPTAAPSSVFNVYASLGSYGVAVDDGGNQARLELTHEVTVLPSVWWTTNPLDQDDLRIIGEWYGDPPAGGMSISGSYSAATQELPVTGIAALDHSKETLADLLGAETVGASELLTEYQNARAALVGKGVDGVKFIAIDRVDSLSLLAIFPDGMVSMGSTDARHLNTGSLGVAIKRPDEVIRVHLVSDGVALVDGNSLLRKQGNLIFDERSEKSDVAYIERGSVEISRVSQPDIDALSFIEW